MLLCSIAHSIICTRLFRGKMHSDWFNGIEILQGRWQHGEKVGYCYPSGLEKTFCKWDIYVPLVTKGLKSAGWESIQWHNAHNDFQVSPSFMAFMFVLELTLILLMWRIG